MIVTVFCNLLAKAFGEGNPDKVRQLVLENPEHVNSFCMPQCLNTPCGNPLHLAIKYRMPGVIPDILRLGCNLSVVDSYGRNPFEAAITRSLFSWAKEDAESSYVSILTIITVESELPISITSSIDLLIKNCNTASFSLFRIIATKMPDLVIDFRSDDGKNFIHKAAEVPDIHVLRFLLGYDCSEYRYPPYKDLDGNPIVPPSSMDPSVCFDLIDGRNHDGHTPLQIAARNRYYDAVFLLLKSNADPNVTVDKGNKLVHVACQSPHSNGSLLRALALNGCDLESENKTRNTPLHVSIASGTTSCFDFLIEAGVDPNVKNEYGTTPLHDAVRAKNLYFVRRLIEVGADRTVKNSVNKTPLDLLRQQNTPDIVEIRRLLTQ